MLSTQFIAGLELPMWTTMLSLHLKGKGDVCLDLDEIADALRTIAYPFGEQESAGAKTEATHEPALRSDREWIGMLP